MNLHFTYWSRTYYCYKGDKIKHYAVHDLKFFPNEYVCILPKLLSSQPILNDSTSRTSFVSTGADGAIRLWNLSLEDDDHGIWFNERLRTFKASPHDLTFKPNTSILAVAEK